MGFEPTRCPNRDCKALNEEGRSFFQRWGKFEAACRNHPVPRFRCRSCKRTFSRQTFRYNYRQKLPHIDAMLLRLLVSGNGLRQSARILHISRHTVARKLARLSTQCRMLHDQLARDIDWVLHLQFDELETFEQCRVTRPVTMGTIIDAHSMFILDQENGSLGPRGNLNKYSQSILKRHIERFGERINESRQVVRTVFERASSRLRSSAVVDLTTDKKRTYPRIARETLGRRLMRHTTISSRAPRGPGSPLHPINLAQAMWRDGLGRLHRRSWLVSKCRSWLGRHAWIYVAYRNYVRLRVNGARVTPAMAIGVLAKRLRFEDIIAWNASLTPTARPPTRAAQQAS